MERRLLKHDAIELGSERRWVIDRTIREVAAHRSWRILALNVRSTHVHVVLQASHPPERVMTDLKARSTRRMVEAGVLARGTKAWSLHGSTRWLNTDESIRRATNYVMSEQGPVLDMQEPSPGLLVITRDLSRSVKPLPDGRGS